MASRSLGTLTLDLIAKVGGFTKGMTEAERAANKSAQAIQRRMDRLGKTLGATFKIAAAAFAAFGGVAALGVTNAANSMDQLSKSAQKVGVATDELSKLAYAAKLSDVEFSQLETSLVRLSKTQDDAAKGSKDQLAAFRALGVEFQNLDGTLRKTDDVFRDLADKFKGLPDGANKTALAVQLFGRAGAQLIPLLNQGSDGLRDMGDELERLGGVVTPEAGRAAEEYNDNITRLKTAMDALWIGVANDLMPELVRLTGAMANGAKEGDGLKSSAEGISTTIKVLADTFYRAFGGVQALINGVIELTASFVNFASQSAPAFALLDKLSGGFFSTESGNLAATSAANRREGMDKLTNGLGIGRGVFTDPVAEAKKAAAEAAAKAEAAKAVAAGLDAERGASERAAASSKANAAARRAAAEAAREQERADAALAKRLEELTQAGNDFRFSLDTLQAQLDGPLAEAELEHQRRLQEVQQLLDSTAISAEDATRAQQLYGEQIAKVRDQLDPYGESLRMLLADMDFELDLLGKTNAERIVELELRRLGISMTTEEGRAAAEAIRQRVEAYEAMQKQISAMDEFRASFADNVASVLDGTKSIKDAIKDMVSDFIAQMARAAANNFAESLFGSFGTTGGGQAGGGFASFFGSFFGGGKAVGGPVMSGVPYLVGEQGPELFVPSASGSIATAGQTARMGGATVVNNFNMPGRYDMRTQAQIATDVARVQQRQVARGTA